MKTIRVLFHPVAIDTARMLKKVSEEKFGIRCILSNRIKEFNPDTPILYYGIGDGWNYNKKEACELFNDIIPNTIVSDIETLEDFDTILLKEPLRIMLWKDARQINHSEVYRFIPNKDEWRVNYSFGKVNSVLRKVLGNNIFGKHKNCEWVVETDKHVRKPLIQYTKQIAQKLQELGYEKITHFGIDFIRDRDTGTFYFLELNRANGLGEKSCELLLNNFINGEDLGDDDDEEAV